MRLLLLVVALTATKAFACLNYYGVTVDGRHVTITMGAGPTHYLHDFRDNDGGGIKHLNKVAGELEKVIRLDPGHYKAKNDLAVTYIKVGRHKDAFPLLYSNLAVEAKSYEAFANLGVAHELSGNLDSAYYYVSSAYQLKRDSHYGSEWIHIKLLETALSADVDKALKEYKMLGVDFGDGNLPSSTTLPGARFIGHRIDLGCERGKWDTATSLVADLEYQLHERTYFIKGNDKTVGELFFTLGDIYSLYFDTYWALWAYTKSMQYGNAHNSLVLRRGLFLYERIKNRKIDRGQHSNTKNDQKMVMAYWAEQQRLIQ